MRMGGSERMTERDGLQFKSLLPLKKTELGAVITLRRGTALVWGRRALCGEIERERGCNAEG